MTGFKVAYYVAYLDTYLYVYLNAYIYRCLYISIRKIDYHNPYYVRINHNV